MDEISLSSVMRDKERLIKRKLNEKYNEDFDVVRIGDFNIGQYGVSYCGACNPVNNSDLKFMVTVYEPDNTFFDTYSQTMLVKKTEKEIVAAVSAVAKKCTILADCESVVEDYNSNMSAQKYNSENNCIYYVMLTINIDSECNIEPEPLYGAVREAIYASGIKQGCIYLYLADEDEFDDIKKYCGEYSNIGTDLMDMCEGSFSSVISNGVMEKTIDDMKEILY